MLCCNESVAIGKPFRRFVIVIVFFSFEINRLLEVNRTLGAVIYKLNLN